MMLDTYVIILKQPKLELSLLTKKNTKNKRKTNCNYLISLLFKNNNAQRTNNTSKMNGHSPLAQNEVNQEERIHLAYQKYREATFCRVPGWTRIYRYAILFRLCWEIEMGCCAWSASVHVNENNIIITQELSVINWFDQLLDRTEFVEKDKSETVWF